MRWIVAAIMLFVPSATHAQVAQFTFTTGSQSIAPNASSEQITLEAQDASGLALSGSTICIRLTSSSGSGAVSTNSAWSDPLAVLTLTLSSNQSRRNFYYRDSASGAHTITAQAGPRPDGSTCTTWSPESGVSWSASQIVSVSDTSSNTSGTQPQTTTSTSAQSNTSNTTQQNAPVSSYISPPEPTIFADAGEDRTVIVGAHTIYKARAYNKKKEPVENARFHWNFGDGTTGEGASVPHHYEYPGRYAVVVSVAQNTEAATDRILVVAEPAKLGFAAESDGSITIVNMAGRDLDLSSWLVRAFFREFVLPPDSIILSGASMRISSKTLGFFAGSEAELAYPNGVLALKANQAIGADVPASIALPVQVREEFPAAAPVRKAAPPRIPDAAEDVAEDEVAVSTTSTHVAAAAAATSGRYWWSGAFVLAGLAGAGAVALRRMRSKEWLIEDGDAP